MSYLKSKQLFPKKTPSTHGRTYLRMCGHWFCLWILRNWQHLFNSCGVKGLSKLQSAPSICRDKEGKRQTNRTFCSSFPMLERLIWTSTQRQTKRPESTKEMDRIWFRPIHPFTYSSNQNKQLSCLVPFQSVNALRIAEPQGTMKKYQERPKMIKGHERPWMAMNDHKWCRGIPWTSHLPSNTIFNQPLASQHIAAFHRMQGTSVHAVLSVRFVLHHLLQFPLILAKRPHSACKYGFNMRTDTHEWAYVCFDMSYLKSKQLFLQKITSTCGRTHL